MLETQFQNDVSLYLTGEAEPGSGGDQHAGISCPTGMVTGGINGPQNQQIIPGEDTLKKRIELLTQKHPYCQMKSILLHIWRL